MGEIIPVRLSLTHFPIEARRKIEQVSPHLHPIFEMLQHFMANREFPDTVRQDWAESPCGAVQVSDSEGGDIIF